MKLILVDDEIEIFGKKSLGRCKVEPPNVVILESGGVLNFDKGIFESLKIYKKDFELTSEYYSIFNLANSLEVKFLKKFESVINYRFTRFKSGTFTINRPEYSKFIILAFELEIMTYKKNALIAIDGLFASAAKTQYTSSICHFLSILEEFPKLEDKLCYAASIKINNNEK
ncbi:hypothetical protein RhiirC2_798399 [Rhizophagus irregularis]|uniref:Uncharacterized protein n=1 Tax=Rhizophagus irregularis TaxID=588596 RepID=A0A2N1M6I6_9GLOM|nr:hypothetical protein RhiirC2_798399 [Rhizophagus irregularis]